MTRDGGRHALVCKVGGGAVVRHNAVRDVVASWLRDCGFKASIQPCVPHWDTEQERARLDVGYVDQRGDLVHLDVSLIAAATTIAAEGPARQLGLPSSTAATPGRALCRSFWMFAAGRPPARPPARSPD